jgi:hypothetical protein
MGDASQVTRGGLLVRGGAIDIPVSLHLLSDETYQADGFGLVLSSDSQRDDLRASFNTAVFAPFRVATRRWMRGQNGREAKTKGRFG